MLQDKRKGILRIEIKEKRNVDEAVQFCVEVQGRHLLGSKSTVEDSASYLRPFLFVKLLKIFSLEAFGSLWPSVYCMYIVQTNNQ